MSFEIVPNSIYVLPNDKQRLRLRTNSRTAIWHALANATVGNDYQLSPISLTGSIGAVGGQRLASGVGAVSVTLTSDSLPTTGNFSLTLASIDFSVYVSFIFQGGTVTFLNELGVVGSEAYTPTVGDVWTLEASGAIWRCYLNGAQKIAYAPVAGIEYPCEWSFGKSAPQLSTTKIPRFDLVGDWSNLADADWIAPAHGNLSSSSGVVTEFRNGTIPGSYKIKARYANSALQEAVADVIIPPLMLAMPSAITAKPGDRIELLTNYDEAQTQLVTWTALDGGTLNGNEYFAPTTPGNYRLRASSGAQRVLTTITVPIVIQPAPNAGQKTLCAVGKAQSLQLQTNLPSPTWSCVTGSITSGGLYTAPVTVGRDRIMVTSGSVSQTIVVEIVEVFPVDPTFGYSVENAKTVVVNRTEDDLPYGRVKAKQNQPRRRYELKFENADEAELTLVEEFWGHHFPQRKFIYHDKLRGEKVCVLFDSYLKYEPSSTCDIGYSFRLVEA